MLKHQPGQSDVARMANAIHTLNTAPNSMLLGENDKDLLQAALLAFDHEWVTDHWRTPFGDLRTMHELRQLRDRISKGELPPNNH
ncbi:MAG: hypothetical protein M3007_05600 [Candidatus Eremiobacteraeota bacterium]|nr:hypothetical protein [Candidatus Eremiobacteraeota bacterium]